MYLLNHTLSKQRVSWQSTPPESGFLAIAEVVNTPSRFVTQDTASPGMVFLNLFNDCRNVFDTQGKKQDGKTHQ